MQDREFEKQVRQKMQELRVPPNADVWARVQADIRKKKRRRPLIIFLLLAGLMVGTAWLYFGVNWNGGKEVAVEGNKVEINNKEQEVSNKKQETDNKEAVNNKQETNNKQNGNTVSADKGDKPAGRDDNITNKNISSADRNISKTAVVKNNNKTVASKNKSNRKLPVTDTYVEDKKDSEKQESVYETLRGNASYLEVTQPPPLKAKTTPSVILDSSILKPADKKDLPLKPNEIKPLDSLAKKPFGARANNKKKDWEWGASAGVGYANAKTELSFAKSFGSLFSNAPTRDSFLFSPEVKGSIAFNVGGYVSKGIGKRLRVKAGLNYEYYSTTMQVGSFVDSAKAVNQATGNLTMVDAYYKSGDENKYTNSYHFVSVPLSVQWQVNRNAKRSIVWENGISLARLINSRSLQYDPFSRSYYKDKSAQNKTQWMASSSVLFRLLTKSNRHVYAGPQVQYAFTNLVKDADNKHLRYAGLKFMMSLNKN
jgi:hypothetical protein